MVPIQTTSRNSTSKTSRTCTNTSNNRTKISNNSLPSIQLDSVLNGNNYRKNSSLLHLRLKLHLNSQSQIKLFDKVVPMVSPI